ncbi:MAG: pyridoxal-phosphate dependent enzyme [Melioribacteraceae bacterium]|nr:pyridoxal-phosphate dependent enzyme [Melioribacteraceae bacterium]MCF8355420.1 pyridoxal-phosphate dependent enzyme [Melioribacteraceae bacterium]MCF8393262.1 pyridoxal-phosphate dependent enzyme [Melioribacteraceae bacterium]MCF8417563.1 pyridoxal-phosphate dependent enzyme [Melioribacteraceae bacterium]
MKNIDIKKSVTQKVVLPNANKYISVYIQREDLIHPYVNGNKYYKLKYNLEKAKDEKIATLLTFGGAYSNHIYATAAAAKISGFKSIGIIRGEEYQPLNSTLQFAVSNGMKLYYLDRKTYRRRTDPEFREEIAKKFGRVYIVPEGGTNELAVKGAAEIIDNIDVEYDYLCTAVGSGGTIAGLIAGSDGKRKIIGFPAIKNGGYLADDIRQLLKKAEIKDEGNWSLQTNYHLGGFAKLKIEQLDFIKEFVNINNVPLDFIYTSKMLYGINNLIEKEYFEEGSRIVAIHTGGLQGNLGMKEKVSRVLEHY